MNATRYRLPDGTDAESVEYSGDPYGWWEFRHPTLGRVRFPGESLTLVPLPLPTEPPDGAVVLVGPLREVYHCDGQTVLNGRSVGRWYRTGSTRWYTWAEVVARGSTFVRLVPANESEAAK